MVRYSSLRKNSGRHLSSHPTITNKQAAKKIIFLGYEAFFIYATAFANSLFATRYS